MPKTVLVVDDDDKVRELLVEYLAECGFGTVACDSAEAGLEAFEQRDFDWVITDVQMPGKDGIWLTAQLLQERPGLNIVVMSSDDIYESEAVELGAAFFPKGTRLSAVVYHLERKRVYA